MKKLCFCLLVLISSYAFCQSNQWVTYNTTNSKLPSNKINAIAIDSFGVKWIVAEKGLVKVDGENWSLYDKSNSALTCPYPLAITIEGKNTVWIGTYCIGLVRFDGTNWKVYNTYNSPMPENAVSSVAIDKEGNKWAGTQNGGVAKFDGTNWTFFDKYNSPLPSNNINCVAINSQNVKFFGTNEGLAMFDGTNWQVFNKDNSPLPGNDVLSVTFDQKGIMWVGTRGQGVVAHAGQTCDIFNTSNSGLKNNFVHSIFVDANNRKWIGTETGLNKVQDSFWSTLDTLCAGISGCYITSIVSDKNGVKWIGTINRGLTVYTEPQTGVSEGPDKGAVHSYSLSQNYPNPFNPSTRINYSIPRQGFVSLKIYNLLGREIASLVNEVKQAGSYSQEFSASSLPSGIYIYTIQAGEFRESRKLTLLK
ncbi:MAG: two-component regulator propeller domain-containing protein [Syntrophomonadaceae bacterium]